MTIDEAFDACRRQSLVRIVEPRPGRDGYAGEVGILAALGWAPDGETLVASLRELPIGGRAGGIFCHVDVLDIQQWTSPPIHARP